MLIIGIRCFIKQLVMLGYPVSPGLVLLSTRLIMLKKITGFLIVVFCSTLFSVQALACVGRTLYVGTLDSPTDRVMAEMLVLLINERTGTTVKIRTFEDNNTLYKALKASKEEERVDIIVEDTADATTILKSKRIENPEDAYLTVKEQYEKQLNIIWLNPFGFMNEGNSINAPLVRKDVLTNFPLLPRVLNKLAGAVNNEIFLNLTEKVKSGDKAKNVAKAFLRKKKFI
jgi:glycine betaine/choline ABC-type transport system substrate-binding protein